MSNVTTLGYPLPYSGMSSTQTSALTTYTSSFMPGAWLYNTNGSIPIYNSISDFNTNQYNFYNSTFIRVLPGYKAICYTAKKFGGTATTVDYANNIYTPYVAVTNIISIQLYYQGIEIKNNNIPKNIPYSITNTNSTNTLDITGLLYYYKFDTDIINYSSASNGNTFALSSATISTTTTKLTSGSLAISSGGYFQVPGHKINPSLGYSVALWYKLASVSGIGAWGRIMDIGQKLNTAGDFLLGYPTAGSGALKFSSYAGTNDVDINYTMDTNWHHVCVTCSIKGYWTVYIDGVETSMEIKNNTPLTDYLNYWYINKSIFTGDGNASCNINQLLIFNRELKPYEIYYLYQNPLTVKIGYMTSQISKSGLQYYYPLNNNFNDISNSNFIEGAIDNAVYTGITTLDRTKTKMTSSSLLINSSVGYFQVPGHYIPTNYTIALWFKLNSYSAGIYSRILDFSSVKEAAGSATGGPILFIQAAGGNSVGFNTSGSPNYNNTYTIDLNWHHICITYSGSNTTWNLYIDGVSVFSLVYTASSNFLNFCYIAKATTAGSGETNCNVNQLAIFSKCLTLSEVQSLYNNPTTFITISNLMHYYPFDIDFFDYSKTTYQSGTDNGTHPTVTINSGDGRNNGTYTNITTLDTTKTKMNIASLNINSTVGFFQVPSHYIPPNYSIALWFKLNSYSGSGSRMIDFAPSLNANSGPLVLYFPSNGSLYFTPNNGNTGVTSIATLDLNWHHICVTYSDGVWNIYIDSVVITTLTYTASSSLLNYCYIGKSTYGDGTTNCNVNQLAVFSKTLSISEVQDLYNRPADRIRFSNLMYYYPFDTDFNDYSQLEMSNRSANIISSLGVFQVPSHYVNTGGYSVSMWYKLNVYSSTGSRVFDFSPSLNSAFDGVILYSNSSGALYFTPNNNNKSVISIGYTMDLNWHHICVTYSGGVWNIYIDSVVITTLTYTATSSLLNYCYIGKSTYPNDGYTNCNVKQLGIYNRTLSLDEIYFMYSNPNCPLNNSNMVLPSAVTNYYPSFPGAYLLVKNKTMAPIYSTRNLAWFSYNDSMWWVLPEFKIIVYSAIDYTGTSYTIDNTYGFNMMCKMSENPNGARSVRLYCRGQQVIDNAVPNATSVNYSANNSIPYVVPYKYSCNNDLDIPLQSNSQPSFPGAWLYTLNGIIPIYETMNNLNLINFGSKDEYYIVMPGFKIITYSSTYLNGTATTYSNDGYSIYNRPYTVANQVQSIALYYRGQPIVNKAYSNPANMSFGISTRLVVPTYTGAIMNIRRSSDNATSDFYSDKQQTYLTTGANNTGTTYASWIGSSTGYITKMYDQSGQGNHCTNTTNSAQPTLALYNGKYVMQFTRANSTCLNITTPCQPNTVFCHLFNKDVLSTGQYINGVLTVTGADYELRFNFYNYTTATIDTIANINLTPKVNVNDWFYSATGNKLSYVNNINSSVISFYWTILSTSVQTPTWASVNAKFNRIGTSNYSTTLRGFNGYMTEMICHNCEMSELDMQHYYADQLILTQNALNVNSPSSYSLNSTYYPSQVQGIWNTTAAAIASASADSSINISFTYQFNYTGSNNTGTFYTSVDNIGWVFINGGAPTYMGYSNWTGGLGVTGSMPIINGINTIEIIGYNADAAGGAAAFFGAFYDSANALVAYTSTNWNCTIVNTLNQTSLLADPIAGGLWVTTYAFTKNTGFYYNSASVQGSPLIQTPNYFSNIQNLTPVSKQIVSNFSSLSAMKLPVNSYSSSWGFKAVGYFVPSSTGTWTFSVNADDVAQVWIGVSATNAVSINQLATPNVTCWWTNSPATFSVSVTSGVKYPILIYMGNSPGTINQGNFNISVTTPTSITLSNVFYYMNCPPKY